MNHDDHLFDALDLLSARISGTIDAQDQLLDERGIDGEVCYRAMLFAQTRIAATLVSWLSRREDLTDAHLLDRLAVTLAATRETPPEDHP